MRLADLDRLNSGKIRDIYRVDDGHLLLVATDKISAYDWVLPTTIPDKGRVLTALSAWWFDQLADLVPHHMVSVDDPRIPAEVRGRAMLCRALTIVPIESVVRGYLAGSGTAEYRETGTVCGVELPAGLSDGQRLPAPIFTPAAKAPAGEHDVNVTFEQTVERVGAVTAAALRDLTLDVYERGARVAAEHGLILADTKCEFGFDPEGVLTLGDEVLTPDSSRYWPADPDWVPGRPRYAFDKQFLRDWLTEQGWDRTSPPPEPPPEVVAATRGRYVEAYQRLTGRSLDDWPNPAE